MTCSPRDYAAPSSHLRQSRTCIYHDHRRADGGPTSDLRRDGGRASAHKCNHGRGEIYDMAKRVRMNVRGDLVAGAQSSRCALLRGLITPALKLFCPAFAANTDPAHVAS